jgi:glyoxylase-like metal-dependent hydrolase (beta-lactamase superfamily II)
MPVVAADVVALPGGIFLWQAYDPAVKAELFSTAVRTATDQIMLVDPIALTESELTRLAERGKIGAIVITNVNHHRAASWYSSKFSAPLFGHPASLADEEMAAARFVSAGDKIGGELEVIELEGAAPGEIALYHPANGGTLIIGDALINFSPYGFARLPRKYCTSERQLERSLPKLLDHRTERILFAHGTPILSDATARMRDLLGVDR